MFNIIQFTLIVNLLSFSHDDNNEEEEEQKEEAEEVVVVDDAEEDEEKEEEVMFFPLEGSLYSAFTPVPPSPKAKIRC